MWMPDRVAFTLGPLTVNWYGVLIASAVLIGYLLARHEQKRVDISTVNTSRHHIDS